MSARAPTVNDGDVLAGKYRVERTVSTGGMGVVVAAWHLELHENVCIKLMQRSGDTERFLREARAAAKLRGEHVCRVMDVDHLADGSPFIVMELLAGFDLARLIHDRGSLPAAEAAGLVAQACEGVGEAHAAGIVHRDIKPSNLFVTRRRDGSALVKVVDFGISKTETTDLAITEPQQLIGTPAYMSPEQMRSAVAVDTRTDVWGLGAVLFELVTGRRPFPGTSATEIIANVLTSPLDITGVPPELAPILVRCLDKDREQRYPSVAELAAALEPIAGTRKISLPTLPPATVSSTAATAVDTRVRQRGSRRVLAIAGAAGVVAIAAIALVATRGHASTHRGGTLHVAMGYEDSGFDLYSILRTRNRATLYWVVEPLMHVGADGGVEPWVLDRTEQRDAGRTLALHVRPDVWFHDHPCLPGGHPVTSRDVAYSLRIAIAHGELALPIQDHGIATHGDDEVIVTLDGVSSFYESELASVYVVPAELDGCDDVRALHRPVGTGPFRFAAAPSGTHWHLPRAPHYWRRDAAGEPLPYLDELDIGPIPDIRETLSQLGAGGVDLVMEANQQWDGILDLRADQPALTSQYASLDIRVVAGSWNNRFGLIGVFVGRHDGALADVRIRRALALAIDRAALVAAADRPLGGVTGRFFTPRMWGYDPTLHALEHDVARARALVDEVAREHAVPPITLATVRWATIGHALVEQAAAVGLDVHIQPITNSGIDDALRDDDGLIGTYTADVVDGEIPRYAPELDLGHRSDQLARLQRELVGTPARHDRGDVYRRIEQALVADVPMIPIAFDDPRDMRDDQVYLIGRRVHFGDDVTGYGVQEAVATTWLDR